VSSEGEEVGLRHLGWEHVAEAAAKEGAGPDPGRLEGLIKGVAGAAGFIGITRGVAGAGGRRGEQAGHRMRQDRKRAKPEETLHGEPPGRKMRKRRVVADERLGATETGGDLMGGVEGRRTGGEAKKGEGGEEHVENAAR